MLFFFVVWFFKQKTIQVLKCLIWFDEIVLVEYYINDLNLSTLDWTE